jgi:DNA-binding CsgD family transcriptional regulator
LKAVPVLATSDAERLLRFVADADESLDGAEPFTPELLLELSNLVACDDVSYAELDRVRHRTLLYVHRPGDQEDLTGDGDDAWVWDVLQEHPVCRCHADGDFRTLKVSDFLTRRALHRSRLYEDWYRPFGFEYELDVAIPSPYWHTRTFVFDRGPGRDFTERDRLVLDHLKPHLERMWRQARTRRLLGGALAALDQAPEDERRGVLLLGRGPSVEFASRPARRLLREFFANAEPLRLPPAVEAWLDSGAGSPLVRYRGERRLTVDHRRGALLLDETRDAIPLTAREREIVSWVARGKTNAEIAALLWISPLTVRRHLENVFAKLGVRTRTAAVTRFLGLIDDSDDLSAPGSRYST